VISVKNLVIIPTKIEFDPFVLKIEDSGYRRETVRIKNVPVIVFEEINLIVAEGGLGKTQFGIQTQFYIDTIKDIGRVFCVGAAGNLLKESKIGDIVIGEKTIEHDIHNGGRKLVPKYKADKNILKTTRNISDDGKPYRIFYGNIASGDEDVISKESRNRVIAKTNALAVAWEGAGGARACAFNKLPFIEIRGLSDNADEKTISDFHENLEKIMVNLADLILKILRNDRV